MPLTPVQFVDESIHRQIKVSRYANGQVKYAQELLDELNDRIAKYILRNSILESKVQYTDSKVYIRKRCIEYRDRFYKYLQKELREFVKEQSKWVYNNSSVKLEKKKVDAITRDVFFEAFSETDSIKVYVQRIFNQVFQLWNAQLTISYRTKQPLKDMVKLVLGRVVK